MKKSIIILSLVVSILKVNAQVKPTVVIEHVKYHISTLNFHKPKTNCTSGFGFCFNAHWDIKAHWEFSRTAPITSIIGDEVYIYAIRSGKIFSVHITSALQRVPGFENIDFSKFELEDGYEFDFTDGSTNVKLKAGSYPVARTKTEFIIDITTLEEFYKEILNKGITRIK